MAISVHIYVKNRTRFLTEIILYLFTVILNILILLTVTASLLATLWLAITTYIQLFIYFNYSLYISVWVSPKMLQISATPLLYATWRHDLRNALMTSGAINDLPWARQLLARVKQFYFQLEQLLFLDLLVYFITVSTDVLHLRLYFLVDWWVTLSETLLFWNLEFIKVISLFTVGHLQSRLKKKLSFVYVLHIYLNYWLVLKSFVCYLKGVKILGILLEGYFFSWLVTTLCLSLISSCITVFFQS